MAPRNWAIYSRFSADSQSLASCADQERECRDALKRQGAEPVVVERDEAVRSGATASREGWNRLVAAAKSGTIDAVMLHKIDRFSREFFAGLASLDELRKLGVVVADVHSVYDLSTAMGKFKASLDLIISEEEVTRNGERVRRGHKGKTLAKFSTGGQAPFGYRRDPIFSGTEKDVDGRPKRIGVRFVPDATTAPVVRSIFERYANGGTKRGIARWLNDTGIRSQRAGSLRAGTQVLGLWTPPAVGVILANPIYVGRRIWNRQSRKGEKLATSGKKRLVSNDETEWITVEDFTEAIIDGSTWAKVAKRLAADREAYERTGTAGADRKKLLSGFIQCAECGRAFVIGSHTAKGPEYRCATRASAGAHGCSNKSRVVQVLIERKVKSTLDALYKDPTKLSVLVAEHNRRIASQNSGQQSVVRALEARRANASAEQQNLVAAIARGATGVEVLLKALENREAEIRDLDAKIETAVATLEPLLFPKHLTLKAVATGEGSLFTGDLAHDRPVVEDAIAKIVVYADGNVVTRFRETGLFEPVRFHLDRVDAAPAVPSPEATTQVARVIAAGMAATGRADIALVGGTYYERDYKAEEALLGSSRSPEKGEMTPPGFEPGLQP